ncbi:MAG: hypothetical protein U0528_10805 [Anaerolineae bacterium]|nr:hypothetical protein [Anaerolineae bacterium]
MSDAYSKLVFMVGGLYSRVREINALLAELAEQGEYQGELQLTHHTPDGGTTILAIHIDGTELTLMPKDDDKDSGFRLDISGLNASIE